MRERDHALHIPLVLQILNQLPNVTQLLLNLHYVLLQHRHNRLLLPLLLQPHALVALLVLQSQRRRQHNAFQLLVHLSELFFELQLPHLLYI